MLELFHETNDFYSMKELEKIAPKLKGIVEKTVKDVVESMVSDGIAFTEKIGTSNYYWSVKGADIKQKKRKHQELVSSIEALEQDNKELEEKIKLHSTQLPAEITEKLETLTADKLAKQKELNELKTRMKLALLKKNADVVKKAANRWTASVGDYGNVYVSIPGQNCIESVKYASSTPYWSGYSLFYSSGYGLDTIPKLANGYQYCYLASNNFNDTSILKGYKASYYRPNDNTCYDDYYKCSSTGVFSFYPNAGCSGPPETISMPLILTPIISPHLGNISVQLYTVTGASLFFSWTTVIPSEDIVPTFDNVGDWFALLFTILTLSIGLYMCYHTYVAVKKAKKLLFTQISNIVAQSFWMTYYIGCTIFWSLVATNVYIIGGISQANSVTFGVATFLGCLLTSYLVSDVLLYEKRELLRIINPIVLIAIHVGFFGANYGGIFILNVGPPVYTIAQIQLVNAWRKYAIFWTLFVFTFNSVVPILVAFKLIKMQMQKKAHKEINLIDPNLKFYIVGQILTFAMNAIMFIVKNYTYLLGNDLAFNNTNPYNIFTWAVHSFLTTKIYKVISSSAKYLQKAGTYARSSYQTGQDQTSSVAPIKGKAPRTNE